MNANELIRMGQRKLILTKIRDDFNGCVERQRDITTALGKHYTNKNVRGDLDWLVKHGYLILSLPGGAVKTYTLTEKVA